MHLAVAGPGSQRHARTITRRVAVLMTALALLATAAPSAHGAVDKRGRCELRGFHVVSANREAVLLKDRAGFAGCDLRSGRHVILAEFEGDGTPAVGVLNGHYAAASGRSCDRYYDVCDGLVEVRDLRTRKTVTLFTSISVVSDIVLRSNGSIAVIATNAAGIPQVWAVDEAGERILDPGPGVDPGTLAIAGRTVYWTRGGVPVSASIE